MFRSIPTALSVLLFVVGAALAQTPVPEVTATFFETPPVMDGKLDDACWAGAGRAEPFHSTSRNRTLKEQTTALVGYDRSNLYVGFVCLESRMSGTRAEYLKDGGAVWFDDCIELFVAPHGIASRDNYVHFGVNIAGTKSAERTADGPSRMVWQARTSRGSDRWTVEIAIPFSTLKPLDTSVDCWRIQFCRNEIPSGDTTSSWSRIDSSFHDFWRFGNLLPDPKGYRFTQSRGTLRDLSVSSNAVGTGFPSDTPPIPRPDTPIIPAPRQMKALEGRFTLTPETQLVVGDNAARMDLRAAEEINQEALKVLGFTFPLVTASEMKPGTPAVLIGEPWLNDRVKGWCTANRRKVTKDSPGAEGYILDASPTLVVITGSDSKGTFWGAQTFRQMMRSDGPNKGYVACAQIRDWPRFEYRGVHLLTCSDGLEFHGKCIEDVFSRYKVNHIVLEAENVRWDSHPEVFNPARGMSKDDVRKLIKIAKDHHITVTPLIQSLGHMEWASFNASNLDLFEDSGTPYAFCPRNEKAYRFMFDIMDEAVELFDYPKYMHIGHDEVTHFGRFPVHEDCARIGKYKLYADDTLRYYDYLKAKGVGVMMWGDVLPLEGYRDQIHRLPKDIVIFDWRYGPMKDFPTLDFYRKAGFPIVACTWYRPENLKNLSAAGERRNIHGMCQTTWTGFLPSDKALTTEFYQIYAYILGAEWAWNPGNRKPDSLPYDPELVFARDFGVSFRMDARKRFFSVPLDGFFNTTRTDSRKAMGWIGGVPGEDLSALPEGSWDLNGTPFRVGPATGAPGAVVLRGWHPTKNLASSVQGIPIGRKATALHFLQATAWETGPGQVVARYTIHYTDGTSAEVPLKYGTDFKTWEDDFSTSILNPVAWRGRTAKGKPIALRRFTWTNPDPGKEIRSVDFAAVDPEATPILLAITAETGR